MEPGVTVVFDVVTAPTPGKIETACAPETLQLRVTETPGATFASEAVNEAMTGMVAVMQVPEEQTWPVPHVSPSALFPTVAQTAGAVGEAQAAAPTLHGFVGWQDSFGTQAVTHAPDEQTRPVPQDVSSGTEPIVLHVPGDEGDVQVSMPTLHGFEGWHAAAGVQVAATHDPALHTLPLPQEVPSGLLSVTMQLGSEVGDAHELVPMVQRFAGWQDRPAAQEATHAPARHSSPAPQPAPSATGRPSSTQTGAPVEQTIWP